MILPLLDAWMPKNCPPDCECVARSLVAMSNARDVKAFLIEISMLPSHAPSILTWDTRLPPSSATAMFMGCPISAAFFSAAAITLRASAKETPAMLIHSLWMGFWDFHLARRPQALYTDTCGAARWK